MKYLKENDFDKLTANPIKRNEVFSFECHAGLKCFNLCCRNLKLFLYPYDVLRLKRILNIDSDKFIDEYTDILMRSKSFFPDVLLSMSENEQKTCPFLEETGCKVYPDRPYSCRTFPMEQGLVYNKDKKVSEPIYFFRPPEFCMGKDESKEWTPDSWIKDQNALLYNKMTILWSNLKSLFYEYPPWTHDDTDNPKLKASFMALYNIDMFKEFVFSSTFFKRYKVKQDIKRRIKKDDEMLLKLGFAWIKLYLWNIKSDMIRT